jgi:hypothetical protein
MQHSTNLQTLAIKAYVSPPFAVGKLEIQVGSGQDPCSLLFTPSHYDLHFQSSVQKLLSIQTFNFPKDKSSAS